jgi:hypothetical protein
MSSKMSMMFSQNFGFTGKISRRPLPMVGVVSGPLYISSPAAPAAPSPQQRAAVAPTSRSAPAPAPAPRSVKRLFNMGNIMSNPGTPCKACGS